VRVGLVILPSDRWAEARRQWQWADDSGFCTAWTYDHIRWGGMPDGPWHAAVTTRVRLGTLVATPNFRHPATLARDALALDDVSNGRLDLGLGPGSEGFDATALGHAPWSPAERLARFEEFLQVLSPIVEGGPAARTTIRTTHYRAEEAPSTPGALQRPLPLTIAAGGAKGLRLAANFGHQWVTIGPTGRGPRTADLVLASARVGMRVESPGTYEESCCGRRPKRSSRPSTNSRSSWLRTRNWASTSSCCIIPRRPARTAGMSGRSKGSRTATQPRDRRAGAATCASRSVAQHALEFGSSGRGLDPLQGHTVAADPRGRFLQCRCDVGHPARKEERHLFGHQGVVPPGWID